MQGFRNRNADFFSKNSCMIGEMESGAQRPAMLLAGSVCVSHSGVSACVHISGRRPSAPSMHLPTFRDLTLRPC